MVQAEHLLQAAILAIQKGDTPHAVSLLRLLLEQQPRNADAWYWLSKTQADPARQRECLVRALRFQPTHAQARVEFEALEARLIRPSSPMQPVRANLGAVPVAPRPQPVPGQGGQPPRRRAMRTGIWLGLLGLLFALVACLSVLLLTASLWQPLLEQWVEELDLPVLSLGRSEPLPAGLTMGYWMFDVQRPLPPGVYIGDLVLLSDGVFWFGYLRGKYHLEDQQTLSLCVDSKEKGTPSTCFRVRVVQSQSDQIVLDIELNSAQGKQWIQGLVYRKVFEDTRRGDLAVDLVGRWQPFPLDHHTRIAQRRSNESSPDDVYLFTASGELWAGGRKISTYRVEDDTIRVPDYFGDFGERFQVDRLGDWMALIGQINQPSIVLSLRRVP
ncbi:MAG: hypothetical protein ANABAC_3079 [Anaerolineae bacterium]|jgi:hypothetical protein|nr:MAG: hypothetical protein ANABAC_3079 [Anaerolineae bacterium]